MTGYPPGRPHAPSSAGSRISLRDSDRQRTLTRHGLAVPPINMLDGVLGDYPFLVCRHDIDRHAACVRCDPRPAGGIGIFVEHNAKPGSTDDVSERVDWLKRFHTRMHAAIAAAGEQRSIGISTAACMKFRKNYGRPD
jgi:hypothetical protein